MPAAASDVCIGVLSGFVWVVSGFVLVGKWFCIGWLDGFVLVGIV